MNKDFGFSYNREAGGRKAQGLIQWLYARDPGSLSIFLLQHPFSVYYLYLSVIRWMLQLQAPLGAKQKRGISFHISQDNIVVRNNLKTTHTVVTNTPNLSA